MQPTITKANLSATILSLLVFPLAAQAQNTNGYVWGTNSDNTIFIRSYNGCFDPLADHGDITIPAIITGLPVTEILLNAFVGSHLCVTNVTIPEGIAILDGGTFFGLDNLATVTIPGSVTVVGPQSFASCLNLQGVYFTGNAPEVATNSFSRVTNATVYYLPGTTGWGATFGGLPTAIWQQQMQVSKPDAGGTSDFGFSVKWASGKTVVVEVCTDLSHPGWTPLQTNTLTSGSIYVNDPQWKHFPGRTYRVRSL
ncbi:MAG TPA: leucine-rich repeat protein [Verrucomicrobiae bacterium]|nr:leucine-rich repeat protein [Verrucomicrobiae bacterium]